jgi:DNA-binding MurR/RpiR family transcriptional regulator
MAELVGTIRARLDECSPAERKVARVLLAGHPAVGFETVAVIAQRAGVSGPTVLRLLDRLGFGGLPDFQQALRRELDDRQASPLALYAERDGGADGPAGGRVDGGGLDGGASSLLPSAVHRTLAGLPDADLDRVVALLADRRRRVLLVGGRFSRLLAEYLHLHLVQLRDRAVLLGDDPVTRAAAVADGGRRDVLVVFDFRRYEPRLLGLARAVKARRGAVVLVTDRWLSPVAEVADAALVSQVDSLSAYDSLVPAMAVVETVVARVLSALGDAARERMAACEQAAQDAGLLDQ